MVRPTARILSLSLLTLVLSTALRAQAESDAAAIRKLLADSSSIGLPIGTTAPAFELKDQTGRARNLASLAGPKGTMLVFFRSADW